MDQEQPQRPADEKIEEEAAADKKQQEQPIKYGDVFNVTGDIAEKKVVPGDAAIMQAAENKMFGYIQKGGPASVMQSAANKNEKAGFVKHNDVTDEGVTTASETDLPAKRMIQDLIGGQIAAGHDNQEVALAPKASYELRGNITIGEALEATVLTSGNRPVDYSDAAAIQAAEVRATGRTNIVPGGVAAAAQSAATRNARATRDEDKTKLGEILADASSKLPADKPVTRRDAEGVIGAELRNDPNLCTRPGGVAASVAAAARLNQCCQIHSPPTTTATKQTTDHQS